MKLFDKIDTGKWAHFEDELGDWFNHFSPHTYEELELTLNRVKVDRIKRTVYPDDDLIFRVYKETPPEKVRVVIIGQDPYYRQGQAIGRAFACGAYESPSLSTILDDGLDLDPFSKSGFDITLQHWVDQGVFLLNSALTVISGKPGSHSEIGWNEFINSTIYILNKQPYIIWLLWGKDAQKYMGKINPRHKVFLADHPVFARREGRVWDFSFERVNKAFKRKKMEPIQWIKL